MNDEHDATSPAPPPAAPPLVAIEYRDRGFPSTLVGPALILLACLAITAHRRPASGLPRPERSAPTPVEPVAVPPAAPLEVRIVTVTSPAPPPEPPPLEADATAPVPPPASPSIEPNPKIGFQPPADDSVALAAPIAAPTAPREPPLPSKEQVWDEIKREAARKQAEIENAEALKPRLRAWELAEARRQASASRARFQDELRHVLTTLGNRAGPAINRLCNQYGRTTDPAIQAAASRALATTYARVGRPSKVAALRAIGLPEPLILDFLARELDATINTRGGPRDPHEVRVRAAHVLLSLPIEK